jgi:hypothetical protein
MKRTIALIITIILIFAVNARGQDSGSIGWGKFDTSQHLWFQTTHNDWKIEADSEQTYFFQFAPKFIVIRGDTVFRRTEFLKKKGRSK